MKLKKKYIFPIVLALIILVPKVLTPKRISPNRRMRFLNKIASTAMENTGHFTENIIIEHTALIETGAVVPGKPIESELYKRLLIDE